MLLTDHVFKALRCAADLACDLAIAAGVVDHLWADHMEGLNALVGVHKHG